nr:PREDICTED: zinc finger CCCH domain-containing protein 18-like [Daucus carota subsp. sativus]
MNPGVKIEIHHGGEFTEKSGTKHYEGGKIEYINNQCLETISNSMFEDYVKHDLGYKNFKLYWYKGSFDERGCKLLWNDEIFDQMFFHAFAIGEIKIIVDHAHETGEAEKNCFDNDGDKESGKEGDRDHESSEREEGDVGGESDIGEDSDSGEDSDYHESDIGNDSDIDEEFEEIKLKKKEVYESKMNPAKDDELDIPLKDLVSKENKKKKRRRKQNVEVVDAENKNEESTQNADWESEYESDSLKLLDSDSTDSSENDEVGSVKKKRHKMKEISNTFNPNTPMKYINFELNKRGVLYWPHTGLPDIIPPKARRMPGRPKKARRREQGEKGARGKIGKKGIEMRCSLCLTPGHNKSTCKATAEEIAEKQSAAAERRKAHSEALKAEAARNRKKKATSQKKKNAPSGPSGQSAPDGQNAPDGQAKRKRGRPPKIDNTKVLPPPPPLPPPGSGVFISSQDGQLYMSTPNGVVRVSDM